METIGPNEFLKAKLTKLSVCLKNFYTALRQPRNFYTNRTLSQLLKRMGEYFWRCDHTQLDSQGTYFHHSCCYSLD